MLRSVYAPEIKHDIVPVDFVSNCIIVSTWYYGVAGLVFVSVFKQGLYINKIHILE